MALCLGVGMRFVLESVWRRCTIEAGHFSHETGARNVLEPAFIGFVVGSGLAR